MMTISTQQSEAMGELRFQQFITRLGEFALELRPDLASLASSEDIARFAEFATRQAREIGFSTEFEIAVFCATMLLRGKGFYMDGSHPLFALATTAQTPPRLRAMQLLAALEPDADEACGSNMIRADLRCLPD